MTATGTGLTSAVSSTLAISTGVAAKLAFTTQPGASTGGVAFPVQPIVTVQDAAGNTVTSDESTVTLAVTAGDPGFTCTLIAKPAAAGVATFSGCMIDTNGTYTLTATSSPLTEAVSGDVVIGTGEAAQLAFTTQPVGADGEVDFGTQPVVTVQDAGGNTVVDDTSSVTLDFTTLGDAILGCDTNPLPAVAGVATFTGCDIDIAGSYTLTATDVGLASAVSSSVTISVGPAAKLAFTTQPGSGTAATALAPQPAVSVQDAAGNTVVGATDSVELSLTVAGSATLRVHTVEHEGGRRRSRDLRRLSDRRRGPLHLDRDRRPASPRPRAVS